MKLYYARGACSLVVRIIINELGMTCDYEAVDLVTKKTEQQQDYLKINPKGSVPAIMTNDGQLLTETSVMLQYLADDAKAVQLLPTIGHFKRYRVLEWVNYVATEMHKGVGILFNPQIPQEVKDKVFIPALNNKMTYLDQHFQHNHYLLGDEFTLPDAYLFVTLTWAMYFNFNFPNWPNLSRYFNELKTRASIKKSLQEEGLKE